MWNMWNLSFPLSLYKSALNSSLITHLSLEGRELKIVYIEFRSQQGTCLNFSTCVKLCYPCHHHCHHKNHASIIIRWRSCDLSCRTGLAKFTDDQRSGNLPCMPPSDHIESIDCVNPSAKEINSN